MRYRHLLFAAVSAASLAAGAAYAQSDTEVQELVVTGTRGEARSKLETIAPVDVVTAEQVQKVGNTELAQALSIALPSLNFPRPTLTDGTDTIRPATLRGLSPDQTLVLVNSKRRHAAALVNLNGSVGYGSGAVDLNTIPTAILQTVEVLRDGASAQYGSDAIAGVINLRLRENTSGGGIAVTVGRHDTTVKYRNPALPTGATWSLPTETKRKDGETTTISAWKGFGIGDVGFVTLALESKIQSHTVRAGPDPRQQYPLVAGAFDTAKENAFQRIDAWYGDPYVEQYTAFINAGADLSDDVSVYGWASYQDRVAVNAGNFRRPCAISTAAGGCSNPIQNILSIYPNGFLPKIKGHVTDYSGAAGLTFKAGGFDWDASVSAGYDKLNFGVIDTLNASLGPTTPLKFNAGDLKFHQEVANLGGVRELEVGGWDKVTLALGAEYRHENYQIVAGEPASYQIGTFFGTSGQAAGGAQVFPGFTPANATDRSRHSFAAYVDVEGRMGPLDVDVAVRGEDYSDFGSVLTGKLAARYDFTENVAIRGAVSNGFRAPSLQQSYITTTSTNFVGGVPIQTILLPPGSATAALIGAKPLDPEKSRNVSGGVVLRYGSLSLTVDAYYIKIKDRVVLSDILQQANVISLFPASLGIGGVRFFTNGVDSETTGVEAVATYKWRPGDELGNFDFTVSASHNDTKLTRVQSTSVLSALTPAPNFLPRIRTLTLTDGQPAWKANGTMDWDRGMFGATLKASYYGKLLQPNSNPLGDVKLEPKTLFDAEVRVKPYEGVTLALGVENIFDTYPTGIPAAQNGVNLNPNGVAAWPEYSPFGFQGRYLYARISYDF
jgi:iron complex outermembrane recepter protein